MKKIKNVLLQFCRFLVKKCPNYFTLFLVIFLSTIIYSIFRLGNKIERKKALKRYKKNRRLRTLFALQNNDIHNKKECLENLYGVATVFYSNQLFNNYTEVHFVSGISILSDFEFWPERTLSPKFFNEIYNYSTNLITANLILKTDKL